MLSNVPRTGNKFQPNSHVLGVKNKRQQAPYKVKIAIYCPYRHIFFNIISQGVAAR